MTQGKRRDHPGKRYPSKLSAKSTGRPKSGSFARPRHGQVMAETADEAAGIPARETPQSGKDRFWLYGWHAVTAALRNPVRKKYRLLATEGNVKSLTEQFPGHKAQLEIVDTARINSILPAGAVHQGLALLTQPLPELPLEQVCAPRDGAEPRMVVVLDQVTDPHNAGAILRSCAAFGASALIFTGHHAPPSTGVLAKAASGALELTPILRVSNLARTLEQLAAMGFWLVGLDSEAPQPVSEIDLSGNIAIVLGAEGGGLRQLTTRKCDFLARLPTRSKLASLNVSNAAAIILYEAARRRANAVTQQHADRTSSP
jgi:23S rRNA (guanosine2251-2'-O)-methyltransferase